MVNEAVIRVRELRKRYGAIEALRGISFDVVRGSTTALLGGNGAGKTTTISVLLGVLLPSAGTIHILGHDMRRERYRVLPRLNFTSPYVDLPKRLTVRENLIVYGRYFGMSRAAVRAKAAELLEFAQLTDRADDKVEPLSGGMKRRLTIARALVSDPEILLLDEPTTGLDPQARHMLWDRLFRLKRQGVTLVLTTHYMDEAEQLCDRLVVMDGGRIVAHGSPRSLIEQHSSREVLELRFPDDDHAGYADRVAGLADRIEVLPDRLLLYTADGEAAAEQVHARGLRPIAVLVRRSTLEDVFLRLTGRTLVD